MKKVLTVDDSKVVRLMVARHLQPFGCTVIEAADGQEGFQTAKRERPDLVLLDVTMPVMDGRQALAALCGDPDTKPIPVVMLTAESGGELVMEIAELGVAGYIVKPFNQEAFEAAVAKVLGKPGHAAALAGKPAAAALPPLDAGVVLVVDDSERVLEAARTALGKSVEVLTAMSAADAVTRFAERHPGTLLIDLVMPDADGYQTLQRIRERGDTASRFVALAVRGDQEAKSRALKAGFAAVVEKPLHADALVQVVTAHNTEPPAETAPTCAPSTLQPSGRSWS